MRKFILTLLSIFVIQSFAFAEEMKFVQVSDVHFSRENEYGKQVLIDTVKDINSLSGVSFVVFTGDQINSANVHHLQDFVKTANKLNIPYYVAIGNHDVLKSSGLSKQQYMEVIKANNFFFKQNKPNYVFKKNKFVFIIVDGAKEIVPGQAGYFRQDTLDWLDKQLTKYKKNPVIIFQHFPLIEPKPMRSHKTHKAEDYLEMLDKHDNVVAVVAGHFHTNYEIAKNGTYHIISPTLLCHPHSYKIITIVTTKDFSPMIYTELRNVEVTTGK